MILDTSNTTAALDAPCKDNKSIIPNNVKEYLFRWYSVFIVYIYGFALLLKCMLYITYLVVECKIQVSWFWFANRYARKC